MIDAERMKEISLATATPGSVIFYWRDRAERAEKRVRELENELQMRRPRRSRRRALYRLLTGQE